MTLTLTGQYVMGNNGGDIGELQKMAGEKYPPLAGLSIFMTLKFPTQGCRYLLIFLHR